MSVASFHKPTDLLLAMGGTEDRLQLVLGSPTSTGYTLLAAREWTVPGQSIRFLTPGLKEVLDSFDVTAEAITKVACVRGPGSFTGMRLVLAAAQGVAAGNNAEVAGIDYLPLLASGPTQLVEGPLHVLTYARRGLVYIQSFDSIDMSELYPLNSLTLDEAAETVQSMGDAGYLMGSGLRKNTEFFEALATDNPGYSLLSAQWDNPSPQMLLDAAVNAEYSSAPIEPIYVRPSDAEDNLPSIAKKRGLDPEKAQKRLEELQKA